MNKKVAAGVLSIVLLVGGATAAYGAIDPDKLAEIKDLTHQVFSLQKQIVDKKVEAEVITQDQADKMKEFIDQRQQSSDQAFAEGKVSPGMGMDKGMLKKRMLGNKEFNNGEPMTADQIKAWSEAAEARLTAQVEAMKSNGKLTEEQIKTWSDAAKAQLKVQAEAMANGTFIPGGMGKEMRGGHRGNFGGFGGFGDRIAPTTPETTPTSDIQ